MDARSNTALQTTCADSDIHEEMVTGFWVNVLALLPNNKLTKKCSAYFCFQEDSALHIKQLLCEEDDDIREPIFDERDLQLLENQVSSERERALQAEHNLKKVESDMSIMQRRIAEIEKRMTAEKEAIERRVVEERKRAEIAEIKVDAVREAVKEMSRKALREHEDGDEIVAIFDSVI